MRYVRPIALYLGTLVLFLAAAYSTFAERQFEPLPPTPSPSAAPAPATPSPSASPGADKPDSLATQVDELFAGPADDVGSALFSIGRFLLLPVLVWLVLVALARVLASRRRAPILVITDLIDATGVDVVGKLAPGLSQGLRERTSTELARVNALYQRHVEDKDRYRDAKRAVTSSPVPLSASHDDLSTLVTAIGDAAPGPAKSALTALSALFPVTGTKVTGYLRAGDDQHGPLSMSFQLADLGDPGLGSSFTIAEVVRDTPLCQNRVRRPPFFE